MHARHPDSHLAPAHPADSPPSGASAHQAHSVADFRRRFWITLALTLPVLALSSELWSIFKLAPPIAFPGDRYALLVFASAVYFYGGWPFISGFIGELSKRQAGMMTLITVAISVAYAYSSAIALGLPGMGFYWELATLIDIMLLGHWIEMRSVMGASGALEALVKLLPAQAHRLRADGSLEDVPVSALGVGERVLVKPACPPTAPWWRAKPAWTNPCSPANPNRWRKAWAPRS